MSLAWHLLRRDLPRADVLILLLSLVISVATVASITLFIDRLALSFERESANLLAADRVASSDRAIPDSWSKKAQSLSLQQAHRISFSSMLYVEDALQLSQISAVSNNYPLKGHFLTDDRAFGRGYRETKAPSKGSIWLSSRLATLLNVELGDKIEVGETTLVFRRYLVRDVGASTANFAVSPRAIINIADVAATQVIIPGSRANYALLLSGQDTALAEFEFWLSTRIELGQNWRTPRQSGQRVNSAVDKAESFLLLAGVLTVVMAGIAMALASLHYVKGHMTQLAMLKTLGFSPSKLRRLLFIQFGILFIAGTAIGLFLGYLGQHLIVLILADLFSTSLPSPSIERLWLSVATGLVSMLAFCLPLLRYLVLIPPMSILQPAAKLAPKTVSTYLLGFAAMYGLMYLYSADWLLPNIMILTILATGLMVSFIGWVAFQLGRNLNKGAKNGWQIGIASLHRRRLSNLFQLFIFTLIILLALVMLAIKSNLISDWQQQLPAQTPNHYLFNVQKQQIDSIDQATSELSDLRSAWYPMVRGRVTAINGQTIDTLYPADRQRPEMLRRELNLTWASTLESGTKVIAGNFADKGLSIERRAAQAADIGLGDILTLTIAGTDITLPVTSIRTVDWSSMQPNFYLLLPQAALAKSTANHVSSHFISRDKAPDFYRAMAQFPTVSVLNVGDILEQIQTIIERLARAIELVLFSVLTAAVLVLIASITTTLQTRLQEAALLRVMGANKKLIKQALLAEFGALGLLSGLLAAAGAEICLYALQVFVFNSSASWHPMLWLFGPVAGLTLIAGIGLLASRTVVSVSPLQLLRPN